MFGMMGSGKKKNHIAIMLNSGVGENYEPSSSNDGESSSRHMPLLQRFMSAIQNGNKEDAMRSLENLVRSITHEQSMEREGQEEA